MEQRSATELAPPTSAPPVPPAAGRLMSGVPESKRIAAMDVLRGVAILGIFCVNIQLFARPLVNMFGPIGGDQASMAEQAGWAFIKIFCEYKFITLFSLLFGMGLVVQLTRSTAAGSGFGAMYLRRLAVLAGFGLVHALGMWYGDILFMYACYGLVLLALSGLNPKPLVIIAIALLLAVAVISAGIGAVQVLSIQAMNGSASATPPPAVVTTPASSTGPAPTEADEPVTPTAPPAATDETSSIATSDADDAPAVATTAAPASRLAEDTERLRDQPFAAPARVLMGDPQSVFGDRWRNLEVVAYRDGPLLSALSMRIYTYAIMFSSAVFSFGWRVLAVFLIGAAMMKSNFFDPARRPWHVRLLLAGLLIGLPLEGLAVAVGHGAEYGASWTWLLSEQIHYFGSLFLCFGYVGAITLIAGRGRLTLLERGIAAVGRMALTNYLLQTLIATYVMYWWGLGKFDTFSRAQMLLFVSGVFAGQIVFSLAWLQVFRMGPMEWLWRSLTYLRPQRIRRDAAAPVPAAVALESEDTREPGS